MKDNFSSVADLYAQYRPSYPQKLFDFLYSIVRCHNNAWDVGTGNGQVAFELSKSFHQVMATDISQAQIDKALKVPNILYSIQPAEETNFPDDIFNLITVAQAIHWFDFERFYKEVVRVSKPDAVLCAIGYGVLRFHYPIDEVIQVFYKEIVGPYWDSERKYIDEAYKTIPFPFEEISSPELTISYNWTFAQLIGYFNTWSAVKHYMHDKQENPVDIIKPELHRYWGDAPALTVHFPVFMRTGVVQK